MESEMVHPWTFWRVPPLPAYSLEDVAVAGGRVWPAALLIAAYQRGVVRVDEQDAVLPALFPLHGLQIALQLLAEVPPSAYIHHDDNPVRTTVALRSRLHNGGDHTRWEVVYAEVPRVFESLQSIGLSGAREPRDDDDPALARVLGAGGRRRLLIHASSTVPPGMRMPSRGSRLALWVSACNRLQVSGYRLQVSGMKRKRKDRFWVRVRGVC